MKKKLIYISSFFAVLILLAAGTLYYSAKAASSQDISAEHIIALNEIEQLADSVNNTEIAEKASELQDSIRTMQSASDGSYGLGILCGISLLFIAVIFSYIYFAVLRPFDKLEKFAQKIAQGNFDVPLRYERTNYFGAFTWAFDSMRREITKSRACEREAIENNKTVIATLSHDIKTPIASIRAYAEGLEANFDSTPEKRMRYLSILMKKCDEVSQLTNDLFLHSLADLDKLKITSEKIMLCEFMENAVREIAAEQNDVHFSKPRFETNVLADPKRLIQITENLINNARKYAGTDIDIWITEAEDFAEIHFRDYGCGIPDEDMPFIFDKFYRGKNCGEQQGSGLGLYIVKYITNQQGGNISLYNHKDGLEAVVSLPYKKN